MLTHQLFTVYSNNMYVQHALKWFWAKSFGLWKKGGGHCPCLVCFVFCILLVTIKPQRFKLCRLLLMLHDILMLHRIISSPLHFLCGEQIRAWKHGCFGLLCVGETYRAVAGQRVVISSFTLRITVHTHRAVGIFSNVPDGKEEKWEKNEFEWWQEKH